MFEWHRLRALWPERVFAASEFFQDRSSSVVAAHIRSPAAVGVVMLMMLTFAWLGTLSAQANLQQAPNSRVVIDLPDGYEPSRLFSGFQNDTLGVTFVVLEASHAAYDGLVAGFDATSLRKRGITDVQRGKLARTDTHVYMRARQVSIAGSYAKFFVAFQTDDQSVLVSVNVPETALEAGSVRVGAIEAALATARTVQRNARQDLYRLTEHGPFKEAGTLVGTSKVLTLDGRLVPEQHGMARAAFIVAPSLDKRPVSDVDDFAVRLLQSLSGYRDINVGSPRVVEIAGLKGVEVEAQAINDTDQTPMRLHQTVLVAPGGGYFRLLGLTPEARADELMPAFEQIAAGFEVAEVTAPVVSGSAKEPDDAAAPAAEPKVQ